MRPNYDGVKFYNKDDMCVGFELKKAEPILESFNATKEYDDVNVVIELYCIKQLIETDLALSSWPKTVYRKYRSLVKDFNPILGRFFGKIDDSLFIKTQSNVCISYLPYFWKLFVKFKVYSRISSEAMREFLKQPETNLYELLKHRELVEHFDSEFAEALRSSIQTAHIIVSNFLENSKNIYYLPKSFVPSEYEKILLQYVRSKNSSCNILQLICDSQSTEKCPMSDNLRLEAKHAIKKFWSEEPADRKFEYGIIVKFQVQDELKLYENQGDNFQFSYDLIWFEKWLDYPTILNNFRYVFEMIDIHGRSNLVSVKSQIGTLEDMFAVDGVKFYKESHRFKITDNMSSMQMSLYHDFLLKHDIDLEVVFKWFFDKYLPNEFGIKGFCMNASTSTATCIEKCRNLSAEMDGVLKQFRMFVRDGIINRELFEMSSEHMFFERIPSLIDGKYVYAVSNEINKEMFELFSEQSLLGYNERTKNKYTTLFDLLQNEKMNENDFQRVQLNSLRWLVKRGSIIIDESGTIKLATPRALILKDLYEHDVLCIQAFKIWKTELDSMIQSGDLTAESTLFSQPETDYLNYVLNKSKFSNGLDLRNKYAHSTYSISTEDQKLDYVQLLKLMVLVITKINDEFCFREDNKVVTI